MALFDGMFEARDRIAHEMDIDFEQPRRSRASRAQAIDGRVTETVLKCAAKFLVGVDNKLVGSSTAQKGSLRFGREGC